MNIKHMPVSILSVLAHAFHENSTMEICFYPQNFASNTFLKLDLLIIFFTLVNARDCTPIYIITISCLYIINWPIDDVRAQFVCLPVPHYPLVHVL